MTVESATYISQLNTALPSSSDPKSEGDDHVRLLKSALKATFPNFGAAALAASNTQLDKVVTTFSVSAAPAAAVYVDASGNVGVGATPSGWSGVVPRAIQIANGVALASQGNAYSAHLTSNAFFDGAWRGIAGGAAGALVLNPDGLPGVALRSATVSAPGATITWADRFVVDPSGNCITQLVSTPPALASNATMVFSLASDAQLRVSVRGSDGVTRTATITLA